MEWLSYAERHYHPSSKGYGRQWGMKITAPLAEAACQTIRGSIQRKEQADPVERFAQALEDKDVAKINSLLNSAWFGVPESTDSWGIEGFREAVELLEDLPEEEEEAIPEASR
jgi:hypothetical protein